MLCLVTSIFSQAILADQPIVVSDAWIADAPAISKIRAGYLMLQNKGKHAITIKSFSSPNFERIELHKTVIKDGMVKMESIKQLTIKPDEIVEFKAEAYHLMLFTPKQKLNNSDKVKITIQLEGNKTSSFTAIVKERGHSREHSNHKMHH